MENWYQRKELKKITAQAQTAVSIEQAYSFTEGNLTQSMYDTILPQFANMLGRQILTTVERFAQQIRDINIQLGIDTNESETQRLLYEIVAQAAKIVGENRNENISNVITTSPEIQLAITKWLNFHRPTPEQATQIQLSLSQGSSGSFGYGTI